MADPCNNVQKQHADDMPLVELVSGVRGRKYDDRKHVWVMRKLSIPPGQSMLLNPIDMVILVGIVPLST